MRRVALSAGLLGGGRYVVNLPSGEGGAGVTLGVTGGFLGDAACDMVSAAWCVGSAPSTVRL